MNRSQARAAYKKIGQLKMSKDEITQYLQDHEVSLTNLVFGKELNGSERREVLNTLRQYHIDAKTLYDSILDRLDNGDNNQMELDIQANRKNRLKKLAQMGRGITMSDLYNYAKSLFKERGKSINNEEWSGMNDNVKITSADGMFDVDIKRMDGRWHVFYEGKREEYSPEGNPNELGNYEPLGPDVDIAGGYGDG